MLLKKLLKSAALTLIILSSCGNKSHISKASMEFQEPLNPETLPTPQIPLGLNHQQTIDFVLTHFWDDLNINDTAKTHNSDFLEQNFANYSLFLANTNDSTLRQDAVRKLMKKLESDTVAYKLMANTAYHYLYDPNSPLLSEESYIPFLVVLSGSSIIGEAEKSRNQYLLDNARKNRPGSIAADFRYENRNGDKQSLHTTPVKGNLILMFYDPDCEHCNDIIAKMIENNDLKQMITNSELTLLAIYSGENKDLWKETAYTLPGEWIVGYENGEIDDKELYMFMATPTFYLLDKDKKVIFKDI